MLKGIRKQLGYNRVKFSNRIGKCTHSSVIERMLC